MVKLKNWKLLPCGKVAGVCRDTGGTVHSTRLGRLEYCESTGEWVGTSSDGQTNYLLDKIDITQGRSSNDGVIKR